MVKTISKVNLPGARKLSPLEMNGIHFSPKRTILTPEQLEKLASAGSQQKSASPVGKTAKN